MYSSTKSGSLD